MSEEQLRFLVKKIEEEKLRQWTFCAFNKKGDRISNVGEKNITAITWGVFPGMEIIQPTVCDTQSFSAWKSEAFALWSEWVNLYPEGSQSREIVKNVQDNYYLVLLFTDVQLGFADLREGSTHETQGFQMRSGCVWRVVNRQLLFSTSSGPCSPTP